MKVRVTVYAMLRRKLGWKTKVVELNGDKATLKDVLEKIPELYKLVVKDGKIAEGFLVLVNGIHAQFLGELEAEVKDGSDVDIFPPGGGG